jgi:formiminotetrahydrofolate cyclodeaminase
MNGLGEPVRLASVPFDRLLAAFAEPTAAPGGGSAAALVAALAAALVERCAVASHPQFVDVRSRATALRKELVAVADEDALALARFVRAIARSPGTTERAAAAADASVHPARLSAAAIEVAELAESLEHHGAMAFRGEAHCAGLLAGAAARAAQSIVSLNAGVADAPG